MTAITQDRDTKRRDATNFVGPVAAGKKIFTGALVCIDAAGNVVPGATSATLTAAGVAQETVDNLLGQAGDKRVNFKKGTHNFANSGGADLITRADMFKDVYIVDDQTVARTSNSGARSIAGKLHDIDVNGIWVRIA